jgi:hypothetical protein
LSDTIPPSSAQASGDGSNPSGKQEGIRSPMESYSGYRGKNWSPQRLAFHQNLENFAERVGLIVGLQSNGKITQEQAYAEIRKIWKELKESKGELLS